MFTEQRARWLYERYRWLEAALPPRGEGSPRRLILPTVEFYPMRNTRDHAFATSVFETTRALLDMEEWACHLTPQAENEREQQAALFAAGVSGEMSHSGAAGTFRAGEEVEITYSPSLLSDPVALVATLAHELCHYLLLDVQVEPPAGWEELEPLTDLAAVVEGFGVFLCNSAFSFDQWCDGRSSGWQWQTRGYLNTAELGFALGIFCVRGGCDPAPVMRLLKANPREVFRDSLDYIAGLEQAG